MNFLWINTLILINQIINIEGKFDVGLMLVIESSVQNNDMDILCALRKNFVKLQNNDEDTVDKKELDLVVKYIDHFVKCNSNYPIRIQNASTTTEVPHQHDLELDEGINLDM